MVEEDRGEEITEENGEEETRGDERRGEPKQIRTQYNTKGTQKQHVTEQWRQRSIEITKGCGCVCVTYCLLTIALHHSFFYLQDVNQCANSVVIRQSLDYF